jgi:hypothetical protein
VVGCGAVAPLTAKRARPANPTTRRDREGEHLMVVA